MKNKMKFKVNEIIDNSAGKNNPERGIIIGIDKKNKKYKIESLDRYNKITESFEVYYQYEHDLKNAYVLAVI